MNKIRVSLSFHKVRPNDLDTYAEGRRDNIFGNPGLFPAPPIAESDLTALIADFFAKRAAYKHGGSSQKGPYQAAMKALMDALDLLAAYVTEVAQGDEIIITISGFTPTKGSKSKAPKPLAPDGLKAWRGNTGELNFECGNQDVADYYGACLTEGAPLPPEVVISVGGQVTLVDNRPMPPTPVLDEDGNPVPVPAMFRELREKGITRLVIDLNKGRRKTFVNLQPGRTYWCVFFAGNAKGASFISQPISIQCW